MKSRDVLTGKTAPLFVGAPVLSFVLAASVMLAVLCCIDPVFIWFAVPRAQAGTVVSVTAVLLAMEGKRASQYSRFPGRILRQDSSFFAARHDERHKTGRTATQ